MTIPSTTRRAGPFYGPMASGAQIPFSFKVFAATDIAVTIADADGVETAGVLNSNYLVTLNADQTTSPGGYIQYAVGGVVSALPTGYTVAINGAREYSQDTQLTQGSNFNPISVERAFDVLTILVQQLKDAYDRTAKITVLSPSGTDTTLPIPEASSVIGWNEDGTALRNYPPDTSFSTALLESQLASVLNVLQGDAKLGVQLVATGAAARTQHTKNTDLISHLDFSGVDPTGASDSTAGITAALAYAARVSIAPEGAIGDVTVSLPPGRYKISSLDIPLRVHLRGDGAVFTPLDTTTSRDYMFKVLGHSRLENIVVDANYAMNYASICWVRSRHNTLANWEVWRAASVFRFGDPAWEISAGEGDLGDSENLLSNCKTIWCVNAVKAYGQNTIVHFDNCLLYSFKDTLLAGDPRKAAWDAQSEITLINCGAFLYFNGGCLANFVGTVPLMQSRQQLASDAGYENSYGKFVLDGVHLETGYFFAAATAGGTVQDDSTKMLTMTNCHGYVSSGRASYLINGGASKQEIIVQGCGFYGNVNALVCQATAAKVHIDPTSFRDTSVDFFQTLDVNKPMGYSRFMFVNATTSSQALTGTPAAFKPTVLTTSDLSTAAGAACFNTGTGIFTAPTDMRDVEVLAAIQQASGATADEMDFFLYVNTVQVDTRVSYGVRHAVTFNIRRLAAGDTVEVRVAAIPNRSLNGSATANFLHINANC